MANQFTYQVLKDTTQKATIKITGFFDGSSGDETNNARIQANTLYGALDANSKPLRTSLSVSNTALSYYNLSIEKIWFEANFSGTGHARLFWNATTPKTIIGVTGQGVGEYNGQGNWITIPNNAAGTAGVNGDIGIQTYGASVANSTYNIILEIRKDNAQYQRGQFNDPAAFNYSPYTLEPH
jgi:hypothetical protein